MDAVGFNIILALALSLYGQFGLEDKDLFIELISIVGIFYFGIAAYGHFHKYLPWG
jgi:hypothetical protein